MCTTERQWSCTLWMMKMTNKLLRDFVIATISNKLPIHPYPISECNLQFQIFKRSLTLFISLSLFEAIFCTIMSPLIDTLVENSKYMPQNDDTSSKPTKCETECELQQAALVKCMNFIRDTKETDAAASSNSSADNSCLGPSISAWTECCTKASAI